MRKYILGSMISIFLLSGSMLADVGHATHTAGTIGAIGNNGTTVGSGGRDVLVGGTGADHLQLAGQLLIAAVQYLIQIR